MNIFKKAIAASALAATALVATTTPALARHDRGGNDAAIAIGAGVVGLALGAIIASSNKDRYHSRYHVRDGWYYNDGYYYNRHGHRYNRHDWERRYGWNNRRHRDRWDRDDYRRGGYGDRYYYRRGY